MNRKLGTFAMFACILTFCLSFISCDDGSGNRNNHLVGTVWEASYGGGLVVRFTFISNNEVIFFDEGRGRNIYGTYSLSDNSITLNFQADGDFLAAEWSGTISGNIMTMGTTDFIRQ